LTKFFHQQDGGCRIPVCEVPELPARDVEAAALISRQQSALRLAAREILHDRIRLPQHVIAVAQRRHHSVGIERDVVGRLVLALRKIKRPHRDVEAEVMGERDRLEGARARRKREDLDAHDTLPWLSPS
jgi:hypothetical protein